jgi:hypothetical protein
VALLLPLLSCRCDVADVARKAVDEVLSRWQALLSNVSDEQQAKLQHSMGLKIWQLSCIESIAV